MTPEDTLIHCPDQPKGMTRDEIRSAGRAMAKIYDHSKERTGYVAGLATIGPATIVRLVEVPKVGPAWEASPADLSLASDNEVST